MSNERSANPPIYTPPNSSPGYQETGPSDGKARNKTGDGPQHTESIPSLIRGLADDLTTLLRKEVSLAKAEMRESAKGVKTGLASMVAGAGLTIAGLVIVLLSAVYGLATIVDMWLAALIVGVAALLIGFGLVKSAQSKMEPSAFKPERTMDQVHKDKETAERKVK